jgi:endonuclease YncB( thermonuclease family)
MKKFILSIIFLIQIVFLFAQEPNAVVLAVHDGDSYKVRFDSTNKSVWIRLWGVDCPEVRSNYVTANQKFGVEVGDTVRQMLKNQRVYVDTLYRDIYNRLVATVYFGEIDMTPYLIQNGFAWYSSSKMMDEYQKSALKALQSEAKKNKVGLWSDKGRIISPATFRKRNYPRK